MFIKKNLLFLFLLFSFLVHVSLPAAVEPTSEDFALALLPANIQLDDDPDRVATIDLEVVLTSKVDGVQGWSLGLLAENHGLTQFYIENAWEHPGMGEMIGDTTTGGALEPGRPSFHIINYYTADDYSQRRSSAQVPNLMFNEGVVENEVADGVSGQWGAVIDACVLDFIAQVQVPAMDSLGIMGLTVKAQGQAPSFGNIVFTDAVGDPPVEVVIVWNGQSMSPQNEKGDGDVNIPPAVQSPAHISYLPSEPGFIRGDANVDGRHDLADAIYVLEFLFGPKPAAPCLKSFDANDDGRINLADPIRLLDCLFANCLPLPDPFDACAKDMTEDALDCRSFHLCE